MQIPSMALLIASAAYAAIFIAITTISIFINTKMSRHSLAITFALFGASYASLAFFVQPPEAWDLWHHFREIDAIRNTGTDYLQGAAKYRELVVTNYLFYFVSLLPSNNFLTSIVIFLEFSVFTYVLVDVAKRRPNLGSRTYALTFFYYIALTNVVYSISGIRNVLAFVLCGLAVYLDHSAGPTNSTRRIVAVPLYLFPIFIHPSAAIFGILRLVAIFRLTGYLAAPLVVLFGVFSDRLPQLLLNLEHPVLRQIGGLLSYYSDFTGGLDPRLWGVNLVLVLVLFLYAASQRSAMYRFTGLSSGYTDYFMAYCLFMFGAAFVSPIIFTRMLYGLGLMAVPIIAAVVADRKHSLPFTIFSCVYLTGVLSYQAVELIHALT